MEKRETNLYRLRLSRGYMQKQLADVTGINRATISKLESGMRDINRTEAYTVYLMAQALGCSMEGLLELEREEEKNGR